MSVLRSQDVHLIDYLRLIYKRRVFFAIVILVVLAGAGITTHRQLPLYASFARILLDQEATVVDFPGVTQRVILRFDTEMQIMKSREVAEYAVRTRLAPDLDPQSAPFEALVSQLIGATGVSAMRNTTIVDVRAVSVKPEQARDWAQAMADAYIDLNFEWKKAANQAAAVALREEIERTQRELEIAERRLMDFKAEYNLVSDRAKQAEQEKIYGAGTSARVEAELKKTEYEKKYQALQSWYKANDFTLPLPPELTPNSLVTELYGQIVKKRMDVRSLLSKYREQHPKVQAVHAELRALERAFDGEIRNALEGMRKSAELFGNIGVAHEQDIEKEKRLFLKANEQDWQYGVRQRAVEVQQQLYQTLLEKLSEVNVTTSIVKNNVRLLQRAKAIPFPIRPNWKFNLLVGFVFGFAAALGGVFFLEYLDKTLKTPDDIGRYLALPVLAVVPLARPELLRAPYQAPQLRDGDPGASVA